MLLTGVIGGVAMFIWTSLAHMVLPLGEAGLDEIPNEQAVVEAMRSKMGTRPGLYVFPGFALGEHPTRAAKSEAMNNMAEKVAQNPSGLLMYYPAGTRTLNMGKLLGVELATELIEACLAVLLLGLARVDSFRGRVGFVVAVGAIAALATNVSYWNWYGFPASYIAAYMFTQVVGFLCVGLVAGFLLRGRIPAVDQSI